MDSNPRQYSFRGQKQGENVVLFLRKHWWTYIGKLSMTIMLFLIPLIAWFAVNAYLDLSMIPNEMVWLIALIWFLIGSVLFVYNWLDWYLDIFVVTTMRIIDINQNGLFHRVVGETSLDNVQDVIYEVKGVMPTLFNFGNVIIHTAGPSGDIVFEQVDDPQKVQRALLTEVDHYNDLNTEKIATPEDLLSIMLEHERKKINAREAENALVTAGDH